MQRRVLVFMLLTLAGVSSADETVKPSPGMGPELRVELIRRAKSDQDARTAITQWMAKIGNSEIVDEAMFEASLDAAQKSEFKRLADTLRRTDTENTDRLGKIVEQYGWPTYTLVGKDGAHAAWLLVQHADASPEFQRTCLDLMGKLPRNEINRQNVAYLTDRVLLAEGKKQRYGTQFTLMDGKCQPRPLEDEVNVDQRRVEVGLSPLAEYVKEIEAFYGGRPKK